MQRTIPILHVDSYEEAKAWYVDWQVSREGLPSDVSQRVKTDTTEFEKKSAARARFSGNRTQPGGVSN